MKISLNVCIVDDDAQFRKNLERMIERAKGFACCGSFPTAEDALRGVPQTAANVVLMDINMPGMSGVECVRKLKAINPALQIIMLTVYGDDDQIFAALQSGANGYLLKRSGPSAILQAIVDVIQGGVPMSNYIARKVAQSFQNIGLSREDQASLTKREEEILGYVAKGFINKEIADSLSVGVETIRSHLKSIYEKLHVRSRTEAAVKYTQK